jgi:bla regulator protein blaR1
MQHAAFFAALTTIAIALSAQTLTPPDVGFEVASVKINRSRPPGGFSQIYPGGRFTETNQTLRQIIVDAYGMEDFRVFGGPSWLGTDRFDIDGRAGREVPREQLLMMLRTLLVDRFKLVARTETRQLPVFALTRNDGRTGRRLREASPAECADRGSRASAPAGQLPSCGALRAGPGRISGRSVTMDQFIAFLSPRVDRVVIDRSGMSGLFDLDLEWTPDEARRAALAQLGSSPAPVDPNVPEISTALREQLGLRLQSTNGPVEVLVIESAQQPTEN